eukprot:1747611-Pyramimonas_sp.AAC.1
MQAALLPGQSAADRPGVVARVFRARLLEIIAFFKNDFSGRRRCIIRAIECQMRGLPHAHIALAVDNPPCSADEIDELISCEVPATPGPL